MSDDPPEIERSKEDDDLVIRAKTDRAAFGLLYDRYYPRVAKSDPSAAVLILPGHFPNLPMPIMQVKESSRGRWTGRYSGIGRRVQNGTE